MSTSSESGRRHKLNFHRLLRYEPVTTQKFANDCQCSRHTTITSQCSNPKQASFSPLHIKFEAWYIKWIVVAHLPGSRYPPESNRGVHMITSHDYMSVQIKMYFTFISQRHILNLNNANWSGGNQSLFCRTVDCRQMFRSDLDSYKFLFEMEIFQIQI